MGEWSAAVKVGRCGTSRRPDAQLIAAPFSMDKSRATLAMEDEPGMQIAVYPLRPRSAGMVSSQPQSRSMVGAVRFVRRLVASEPIASEIAAETRPGLGVDSDDAILDAYRAMGTTAYHAVGTCRMGSDPDSVVDPLTGVRGTTGLHVADLSIAPFVPAGNTFAPVMALAWRAAELIAALDASAENGP